MTPFELDILLHYHCIATDCRACVENVPIWQQTRDWMLAEGLLVKPSRLSSRTYDLGPRGEAYIQALLEMPLPQKWVMTSQSPQERR